MKAAQGILTVRGGMTSHAAVVARGMGKCCVSGCGAIAMDEENKQFTLAGKTFHEGDWLSIDGSTGKIYDGAIPTVDASIGRRVRPGHGLGRPVPPPEGPHQRGHPPTTPPSPHLRRRGHRPVAAPSTCSSTRTASPAIREMICSDTAEQRAKALAKLEPMQQSDFEGIYEAMEGLPVTIRFLDPPLHEFVPTDEADIEQLARDMGKTVAEIKAIIAGLHEFNPHDGPPRLPSGRHLSRDRRHADPGRHQGRPERPGQAPRVDHGARDHDPPWWARPRSSSTSRAS